MLVLEDILGTSNYQRNDIFLYNSLQVTVIGMLLEVHVNKHLFFVIGLFRDTFNYPYDIALNYRMVNETELLWK